MGEGVGVAGGDFDQGVAVADAELGEDVGEVEFFWRLASRVGIINERKSKSL
ncbi:MAG: hypothetical protein L0170_15920 [Acidobacteria bacterium]|nr:hypothetical protein [Acidobacteriota bacterium]